MRTLATMGITALVAVGLITTTTVSASAHVPGASDTCTTLSVNLTQYRDIVPATDAQYTTEYQRYSWTGNPTGSDPSASSPSAEPGNWQVDNKKKPGSDLIGQSFQEGNGDNASWFYWTSRQVEISSATPAKANTVTVNINGTQIDSAQFGESFVKDYHFADSTVANNWSVTVVAWDGVNNTDWSRTITGTSTPCVTPPPTAKNAWITYSGNNSATCTADGAAGNFDINNAIWNDVVETTPGQYVRHATANPNHLFANGMTSDSVAYTVTAQLPSQSTNPNGLCYVPPAINVCTSVANAPVITNLSGMAFEDGTQGSHELVNNALHITTTGPANSQSKSAGYIATDFALKDAGVPNLDYTTTSGASAGLNLTLYANGAWVGNLTYEPLFAKYWTNHAIAGLPAGPNPSYQKAYGTLDEFVTTYDAHGVTDLRIKAVGYSLGSGAVGDGLVNSITAGCVTYTFNRPIVTIPATPRANVVATCGVADVYVSNDFTPAPYTKGESVTVAIYVDGVFSKNVTVSSGTVSAASHYTFSEDSGDHIIEVRSSGTVVATATVKSDCIPAIIVKPVTPTVTMTQGCGTYGSVALATTEGVKYTLVSFDKKTGDYVVSAVPLNVNYAFDGSQNVTLTGNVGAYKVCPTPASLAFTGVDSGATLFGGIIALGLMLLGGCAVMFGYRRRKTA